MKFIIKHFKSGDHTIAAVFAVGSDRNQALLGTLRMDEPTWDALTELLWQGNAENGPHSVELEDQDATKLKKEIPDAIDDHENAGFF